MDVRELQFGDLVNLTNRNGERMEGVHMDAVLMHEAFWNFYKEEPFVTFEPIPLTTEILEKNGYLIKEQAKTNMLMVRHGNGYNIEVFLFPTNCVFKMEHAHYLGDNYVTDIVHKCGHYIHEFQHALRLCGLNELANSLVV